MDACWRILGYQTYPASNPTVLTIKVKSEEDVIQLRSDGKLCDLAVYFNRPTEPQFRFLKYTEFFKLWEYSYRIPIRYKHIIPNSNCNGDLFVTNRFLKPNLYIFKRLKPDDNIVRMSMLYLNAGEMWYLRLLLLNIPASSFDDLKYVNNIEHTTFQSAALALNLVQNNNEGELCFKDAIEIGSTPNQLRSLYVSLTLNGFATISIFTNDIMRNKMIEDFLLLNEGNMVLANNNLLEVFSKRFKEQKRENAHFGLPEPDETKTELQIEKLKYDPQQQFILYEQLMTKTPPTTEQLYLINDVKNCLVHNINNIYIVQGQGGSGKTTTAKIIIAWARSQGFIVQGCASTAFAASIYKDFQTAHGLFEIPVIDDNDADNEQQDKDFTCNLQTNPERLELLMNTRIIIWDEISSQNKIDFIAVLI
jgi:hypothetical protein